MERLKAVLFDVDGTIADTEEIHRQAFNESFAGAGLDWQWSRSLYTDLLAVTGGKERIHHFIDAHQPAFPSPGYISSGDLTGFVADLHESKTRIYVHALAEGSVPLRPGVRRLMLELRDKGVRMGVVTTTSPENVSALLENSLDPDAMSWFDTIAAGNMIPNKKPAADIYHFALQELNLRAEDCIAIEDSRNGLVSATGAGLTTLVSVCPYTSHETFAEACLVLDHLGEPNEPFTVLDGDAGGSTWVDLALLQRLHSK